jgi:hypothetical protein
MKRFSASTAAALMLMAFSALSISPVEAKGERYQIVKSENGTLWRLNTETGEIAMCKAEAARMVCTSSGGQIEKSNLSAADLEAAAAVRSARKQVERAQTLDKLVDVFERILGIAEKHQNSVGAPTRAPVPSDK